MNETVAVNSTEIVANATDVSHEAASTEKSEAKVEVNAEAEGFNN